MAITKEAIAKVVAEVMKAAIQAMAAATAEKPQCVAGPAMKQPSFNWEADNKYSELKTSN